MKRPTAWSYTAYSLYEQCPAKYKYVKIDKLEEPKSDAMARGNKIHENVAEFLDGRAKSVPQSAMRFKEQLEQLQTLDPFVEQKWGFSRTWKPTGWMGRDVWYRGIVDAGVIYPDNTADIVDHKTGKLYETNEEQIELFSMTVMFKWPHVTHVTARLWYLDSGDEIIREFSAKERDKLKTKWEKKVEPMFTDDIFAPKPNRFCGWCHFRKSNGGPCRFS